MIHLAWLTAINDCLKVIVVTRFMNIGHWTGLLVRPYESSCNWIKMYIWKHTFISITCNQHKYYIGVNRHSMEFWNMRLNEWINIYLSLKQPTLVGLCDWLKKKTTRKRPVILITGINQKLPIDFYELWTRKRLI